MVHCGEMKARGFRESDGLLSRTLRWCKVEIGVSFTLDFDNTSR